MRSHTPWSDGAAAMFARRPRADVGSDRLLREVVEVACAITGCTMDELRGRGRYHYVLRSRAAAYIAIRTISGSRVSLPRIGAAFCRDHTTVMHAIATATPEAEELAEEIIEGYEAQLFQPALRVVGE